MKTTPKTFRAAKWFACGRSYQQGDPIEDLALVDRLQKHHPDLIEEIKPTSQDKEAD